MSVAAEASRIPDLLGAHMSIAGGTPLAITRALEAGCNALQIFVKNNNRWQGKILSDEEAAEFRDAAMRSEIHHIVAHDSYLINPASSSEELWEGSVLALEEELERCRRLGISHLVVHPGSHGGKGEPTGIRRVALAIDRVHEDCGVEGPRITLEITAGQGTGIGYRFEHLRDILAGCRSPGHVMVCLDTCHLFAAGYDFRSQSKYRSMVKELQTVLGLEKVALFHLNDSKKDLDSRVDRHEHIGQGRIGLDGFRWILNDSRFAAVPKVLETPKGKTLDEDRRNLAVLRSLVD